MKRSSVIGVVIFVVVISALVVALMGCVKRERREKEEAIKEIPEASETSEAEFELPEMAASAVEDEVSFGAGAVAVESGITEIPEADSADVPEDAMLISDLSDDPNALFQVSEEWAKEHEGLYVKIGDNFYSLENQLPADVVDKYGVGYAIVPEGYNAEPDEVKMYLVDSSKGLNSEIPSATRRAIVTSGDFSPLQIHRDDPLVIFSDKYVSLGKVTFVGYTIPAIDGDQALKYYPVVNNRLPNNLFKDHIGVFTLDEHPVDDVRDLEYGKEYLYECYLDTEYRELKVVADSKCYAVERDETLFTAEPTKLGYFTIDISSLEPGFYAYNGITVFEIVE